MKNLTLKTSGEEGQYIEEYYLWDMLVFTFIVNDNYEGVNLFIETHVFRHLSLSERDSLIREALSNSPFDWDGDDVGNIMLSYINNEECFWFEG